MNYGIELTFNRCYYLYAVQNIEPNKGGVIMRVFFDYSKLKGRIVEKFGTQDKFASKIKLTSKTISNKLNNKTAFSDKEIMQWCEVLDISNDEINKYFFTPKVQ